MIALNKMYVKQNQDELNKRLFGDHAILVTANIADHRDSLLPPELAIIDGAIEKRVFEFSTGRHCAHQALKALGIENFPIKRGEQREPLWPENVVGSITHCRDIAAAAVSTTTAIRSIGLDIERRKKINFNLSRHVCTNTEIAWIDSLDQFEKNDRILQIFSVKEAVFKCIYQANRTYLGFEQCNVVFDTQNNSISADIHCSGISLQHHELAVASFVTENHVYSSAIWHHLPAVG